MQALQSHGLCLFIEAHNTEMSYHPSHLPEKEACLLAGVASVQEAGARHKIDSRDKAAALVHRHHDHPAAERDDIVGAAATGEPHFRSRVGTNKAHIQKTPLGK